MGRILSNNVDAILDFDMTMGLFLILPHVFVHLNVVLGSFVTPHLKSQN